MRKKPSPQLLTKTYQKMVAKLATTSLLLQGTITERFITRERRGSHQGKKTLGPYYQWTFKCEGKTTTVNLSKEQVPLFQKAIDANRDVEKMLQEMRRLTKDILDATTQGVKKRKLAK